MKTSEGAFMLCMQKYGPLSMGLQQAGAQPFYL